MYTGHVKKLKNHINKDNKVDYQFRLYASEMADDKQAGKDVNPGDYETLVNLNDAIGKKIKLEYQEKINCVHCGRKSNKSFSQGYCYPCMNKLAECDVCIVKPELCHFDEGTCRDNNFGETHCNIPHSVYISLTSGLKIGITRQNQERTRWVDQGAVQALRLFTTHRRFHAGLIETELAKGMADKTNWRKMLKNEYDEKDLYQEKEFLLEEVSDIIKKSEHNKELNYLLEELEVTDDLDAKIQEIQYPVLEYPQKIKSFNLDKDPVAEGTLLGIKGQYLLMDTGVINIRKYSGYLLNLEIN